MKSKETTNFYNDGFGWACKACALVRSSELTDSEDTRSRMFSEGEAESKNPTLSKIALAKWLDPQRTVLCCPHCGVEEPVTG